MKLKTNREYAARHLFVTAVMLALSCWFGFDAIVRYPATPARELYVSIEAAEPPEGFNLDAFKEQKIQTQYGFAFLAFLAAAIVGVRLWNSWAFGFEFGEDGFSVAGKKFPYSAMKAVDMKKWEKLGLVRFTVLDGGRPRRITLDSWHHLGVKEFVEKSGCGESGGL
ncbi:MAG: hypothetical protein J6W80_01540 [Kiritimatiellae bacterium]|nr:hypothetical protein [Kiritimatiellia bacterium]